MPSDAIVRKMREIYESPNTKCRGACNDMYRHFLLEGKKAFHSYKLDSKCFIPADDELVPKQA